jgi:ATP-binding cassette subfamily E protein 1
MPRIAILDRSKCKHEKCGYACIKYCPGVRMGEEVIVAAEDGYPRISEELCSGCGICVKKCYAGAIKIVNLPAEAGQPVFQYGQNAFRIYGLPLPKHGAVTGLIGPNGVGKSTALKILSGKLKPNFGDYKRDLNWQEVLQRIKGQELAGYLERLSRGARVSHKVQDIGVLGALQGTAAALLEKADERGALREAVETFDINFIEKEISSLSGGELQRLAIAAAYCRDADAYFFDEPSSFLDIHQKMKAARGIRMLAGRAAVLVVEHDLAVLDYLSDYIHVLFGERGAYGRVSSLKGVRSGINEYLAGFLRDENVRFRSSEIRFEAARMERPAAGAIYFAYEKMKKRFPGFAFSCESGEAKKGEVIGMLGPNAIGKSTFVRLLAGVEAPDEGSAAHLRVSYKPQYVKTDFEGTVAELFASSNISGEAFDAAKRSLEIDELMEKDVRHLSGGELQRVAIALCLCSEADVYLLDEPSAFLDIEQRLHFSELLRKRIEQSGKGAFVVDHDIVLIDSVSERLVIFDGVAGSEGVAHAPLQMRDGMNAFLRGMGVTMRRDKDSQRPRINKPGSALDREQKEAGEYFYV